MWAYNSSGYFSGNVDTLYQKPSSKK
jgi:hypothetical protein